MLLLLAVWEVILYTCKQQMAEVAAALIRAQLKVGYPCHPAAIPELITCAQERWLRRH